MNLTVKIQELITQLEHLAGNHPDTEVWVDEELEIIAVCYDDEWKPDGVYIIQTKRLKFT